MATPTATEALAPILQALATMQGNVDRAQKYQANEYLEAFQKSPEAWNLTFTMLKSADLPLDVKLFAATTLKGKIIYDLPQLPREQLAELRNTLLGLLQEFRSGNQNRIIRTQLNVCLAILAIQMTEWKDVLEVVVKSLGTDADGSVCLLEFLKVLPEEVTEGRRIRMTDEELDARTKELLEDNTEQVMNLLISYAQSVPTASQEPLLTSCLTSWLREIPVLTIVKSPLLDITINSLSSEAAFDSAVDCLCAMFSETRDVDECLDTIHILFPRIMQLRPRISAAADDDIEQLRGFTKLFAEAGEAWVILIARMPTEFRQLVEAILECSARDKEQEVIGLTFNFWFDLKNYLVLENYIEARVQLADLFANLVDVMIGHLKYPTPDSNNEADLFDGDREQEERFREFRHKMGDVLKDCCEVLGARDCLAKAYSLVEQYMRSYVAGTPSAQNPVPNWQALEAPLFSMRAMGRMVPDDEAEVLPQIMNLLIRLPEHPKVRFAATLVLGRYTEWTAKHPEYLEAQLNYIINGFQHSDKDVMRAAAMALRYFCQDCHQLLVDHITQLHSFYEQVSANLPSQSLEEVTDGVAHVVAAQPVEKIYDALRLFCEPITKRLMDKANLARDKESVRELSENVSLLTTFAAIVRPNIEAGQDNPAVRFWAEVFPVVTTILESFIDHPAICERVSKFYRTLLISYRTAMLPLLPALAEKLAACFQKSKQGCFLWVTGSVIREFSDEELVDENTREAVYQFLEQQCWIMFKILNDESPKDIPDLIEDFFRLMQDAIMFHPMRIIPSALLEPSMKAALACLVLEQNEPLIAVLHFLRDLLVYGTATPPTSRYDSPENPPQIRQAVVSITRSQGEILTIRILSGLMYSFPRDCVPDSSGVLMTLIDLLPEETVGWVAKTVAQLPPGSVSDQERQKFLTNFQQSIISRNHKKVRYQLQDFTNWYRRKNVTPRAASTSGISTPKFSF
ncbi:Nuclear import receptor [Orbilia brochopaga]|uniref:Nuclear import receptor n=1 Tax=Orbilia brochopaga TaxID=3140254 RepID=A0AAV9UAR2_9PEZI